jgi:hypothetical protein
VWNSNRVAGVCSGVAAGCVGDSVACVVNNGGAVGCVVSDAACEVWNGVTTC